MVKQSFLAYRHTAGAGHELEHGRVRDLRHLMEIPREFSRDPANFIRAGRQVMIPHALLTGTTAVAVWYVSVWEYSPALHFTEEIRAAVGGPPPGLRPCRCERMRPSGKNRQVAEHVGAAAAAFERNNDAECARFAFFGSGCSPETVRQAEKALNP